MLSGASPMLKWSRTNIKFSPLLFPMPRQGWFLFPIALGLMYLEQGWGAQWGLAPRGSAAAWPASSPTVPLLSQP